MRKAKAKDGQARLPSALPRIYRYEPDTSSGRRKRTLRRGFALTWKRRGHSVQISGRGEGSAARLLKKNESYDALVLGRWLPERRVFVARELREAKIHSGADVTARGRAEDVLKGFESAPTIPAEAVQPGHPAGGASKVY